jgi:hypothetical protein
MVAAGLVIGIPAALAAGKVLATFTYGLEPDDPRLLAFAVVALLGAAIPARPGFRRGGRRRSIQRRRYARINF